MKLTVVGSSGSMSGVASPASSYLVQAQGVDPKTGQPRTWSIVMDIGPGSFGALWQYVDPGEVDALLVSHGHADHIADVISFMVYLKWNPQGALPPLLTFGPAEIPQRVLQIDGYETAENLSNTFNFHTVQDGDEVQVGPFTIGSYRGQHPAESYGFRVTGPSSSPNPGAGKQVSLAYTGDTDLCPSMLDMARDVNLLLAECGFTTDVPTRGIHMDGVRAGTLARDSGAQKLVLTHIQPWTDPQAQVRDAETEYDGDVEVARPGRTYVL